MSNPIRRGCSFILCCLLCNQLVKAQEFSLIDQPLKILSIESDNIKLPQPVFILASNPIVGSPPKIPDSLGDETYEVPDPEIEGADEPIPVGELINLSIKPWADKPEDLASVKYSWTILPSKEIVIWPDGDRVIFGTGNTATTFVVVMTASYVFTEADPDGKITEIAQRTVTKVKAVQVVGGSNGGDEPNQPVDPGSSDGLDGLAKLANDWVSLVNISSTYNASSAKVDASKLAASFSQVADNISNGGITDVSTILAKTKSSNDAAITNRDAWLPWFTKMSQYLQEAYGNGTIKTVVQFERAWRDIAIGLNAASK